MQEGYTVIYEARTFPEADELKDRLRTAGIPAVVLDEVVPPKTEPNAFGLPTPHSIAVPEAAAMAARQIAETFDAEIVARVTREADRPVEPEADDAPESSEAADSWPRCPQCAARRVTVCPVCKTSGSRFPWADMNEPETAAGGAQPMVLCPTCDEPFAPQFLRYCEWCNHDFGAGLEPDHDQEDEPISRVVLALFFSGVAIVVAILVYFMILL